MGVDVGVDVGCAVMLNRWLVGKALIGRGLVGREILFESVLATRGLLLDAGMIDKKSLFDL